MDVTMSNGCTYTFTLVAAAKPIEVSNSRGGAAGFVTYIAGRWVWVGSPAAIKPRDLTAGTRAAVALVTDFVAAATRR